MAKAFGPDVSLEGGLYRDRFTLEDGKLWRVREQTNRAAILQQNAAARAGALRTLDGMRWAMTIPQDDYDELAARNPDLVSPDREIKRRAWLAFMRSSDSIPYRVVSPGRGRSA